MGSLESGLVVAPLKRDNLGRSSSSRIERQQSFLQRNRSRFSRFLFFKRLDYLLWICTVAVFLFFVVIFQMFLPGSVMDESQNSFQDFDKVPTDLMFLKDTGLLDFGEDVTFKPLMLMEKFRTEDKDVNLTSVFHRKLQRFGYRKPRLALVFPDLLVDPWQLQMVTIAIALQDIGYAFQVYSLEDGPAHEVWKNIGVPVTIVQTGQKKMATFVNWLNYDGILVNSLEAKGIITCLLQEPFKSIPLIWTIHERTLAIRARKYASSGQLEVLSDWKKVFNRATVIVFPDYVLPMIYSSFDAGNFYVIPGSPANAWEADTNMDLYKDNVRVKMGYRPDDLVIAIVGTQFLYRGLWLEHAFVLHALLPLFPYFSAEKESNSHVKVMLLSGDSTSNYSVAVEAIALNLHYPNGVVKHISVEGDIDSFLNTADVVIYGSFLEEQSFPEILAKAMCFGKPIIAPDLSNIRKYVDDRVNGYLFPKDNIKALTHIILQVITNGKISPLARSVASVGRGSVKNLMALETIEGYALLLENVLKLPSEVAFPKAIKELSPKLKEKWQWRLFENFLNSTHEDRTSRSYIFLNQVEQQLIHTERDSYIPVPATDESFLYEIWKEEKDIQMLNVRKRREEEVLKDRSDQTHGTWEEVYRSVKRADRTKNDLHERDEGELERTGQPLCIYEPYLGEGTWPFLHQRSLYRGMGLSNKGRRPGRDDVDAPSRLPLLNNPYYRDTLGEYGAFFAIANRIDHLHKNAWIGFHSWRATANKASLSLTAENALVDAIQTRRHGDALYFWVRMDTDSRNPLQQDFWSFCDAINAGNCKIAFSESLKRMYGINHDLEFLPPMPKDGDTWAVMQCWALPTRSFLEFVMFSRMFVDALDAQMYDEHHESGRCYLSLSKDKHCYLRLLELLVNVWAYHSARRMVYVNPETGVMQEQHKFKIRRGQMWVKWFSYTTLKSMDEDMAEEADSDHPKRRWLWPSTGEVIWQGVFEKERNLRNKLKEKRKQQSKDKQNRQKKKRRQKVIGKYVKPPPDEMEEDSNSTVTKSGILESSSFK